MEKSVWSKQLTDEELKLFEKLKKALPFDKWVMLKYQLACQKAGHTLIHR